MLTHSRFAAVPGDQSDPFDPVALLTRSPLASVAARGPLQRLRRALVRRLVPPTRESPFDRWLRTGFVIGLEAEGGRIRASVLHDLWLEWAATHDVDARAALFGEHQFIAFHRALDERGIVPMGRDAFGFSLRGPIRLKGSRPGHGLSRP